MACNKNYCYNCDTSEKNLFVQHALMKVCNHCGAWVAKIQTEIDFKTLYEKEYYFGDEYLNYNLGKKVHQINFARKLIILKKYLNEKKDIRLLEIGSATGDFLKLARQTGWENIIGVEISDFSREDSLKNGHNVISPADPNLAQVLLALKPNLIVAWDVWEHLARPSEIFNDYIKYASEDVIVAITTVDSESKNAIKRQENWRQFHPPTHINYPSKRSFKYFFEKKNFRLKQHCYFGYYRPLAEYLAVIFGKRNFIRNSKLLFSIPIYLNLYDTQIIIAERVQE